MSNASVYDNVYICILKRMLTTVKKVGIPNVPPNDVVSYVK